MTDDWPMTPRKLGKSIHQIIWDEVDFMDIEGRVLGVDMSKREDHSVVVTGRLSGTKPDFIIIDEASYFDTKTIRKMMAYARGARAIKPAVKQPDWARHNQAPRSARRRR